MGKKVSNINHLVKGKNTKPEILLRKYLFSQGYRYRINVKGVLGSPDIVFRRYKTIIFVNGCFWHAHEDCNTFKLPKTNTEYWEHKIKRNVERDKRVKQTLVNQGWNVITVWECMLKKKNREKTFSDLSFLLSKIIIEKYKTQL
ncbi:DNA mismatch endonuclease Vsr [Dysgonomonas sp. 216]|uniref:very short patch repair endonuclease n=1 Tax=Dysgonomonas sp. 216 TaxID=2302934 RepID=UPI0013D2AA3C|nr:very short patch repair endonuclease [Dysgonomonas sp. 216]NDW19825.1 DNA mismatch endonuclease Vsr [Dysgonomonas sp. 216]